MTDQGPAPVTSAPSAAPDFIHELLWEQIRRLFTDELQRAGAKMATVSAVSGTNLLVLIDGQSAPRSMPHVAGRRFAIGQRVIVAKVQGQLIALGAILTSNGAGETVIGTNDIQDGAITAAKINPSVSLIPPDRSITATKIAIGTLVGSGTAGDNGSLFVQQTIGAHDLAPGSVTNNKIPDDEITSAKIKSLSMSKLTGTFGGPYADNSIGGGAITDNSLGGGTLRNQDDRGAQYGQRLEGGTNFQDGSIGANHLVPYAVTTNKLADESVTWGKLDPALKQKIGKKHKTKNAQGQVIAVEYINERPKHVDDDND